MSYYLCNRQEVLQKVKERYSKKKLQSIISKIKKLSKKSQEIVIKLVRRRKKQN